MMLRDVALLGRLMFVPRDEHERPVGAAHDHIQRTSHCIGHHQTPRLASYVEAPQLAAIQRDFDDTTVLGRREYEYVSFTELQMALLEGPATQLEAAASPRVAGEVEL